MLTSLFILPSAYIVFLVFSLISLVSEPIEMVIRSFSLLSIYLYLASQVVKAIFWTIYLIIAIVAWTNGVRGLKQWVWITSVAVVVSLWSVKITTSPVNNDLANMLTFDYSVSYCVSLTYGLVVCLKERKLASEYKAIEVINQDSAPEIRESRHIRVSSAADSSLLRST
nr:hypothetical protein CFP56_74642 [Quercus suber]